MKKNKGITLIETLLALSLLSVSAVGLVKGAAEFNRYLNERAMTKDLTTILKSVDTRITIDGYQHNLWPDAGSVVSGNDAIAKYLQKAFISKTNSECGQADGWEPLLDSESNRSFISCNFWQSKIPFDADISIKSTGTPNGFIDTFSITLDFPFDASKEKQMERFEQMHSILKKMKENDYANRSGNNIYGFKSQSTGVDFTNMECLAAQDDCVLEVSWNKQGMYQPLKTDGSNSMLQSNISYKLDKTDAESINTCRIWEKETSGVWIPKKVECGIGMYSLGGASTAVSVHLNLAAINDSVTAVFNGENRGALHSNKVILDKLCPIYTTSANATDPSNNSIGSGTDVVRVAGQSPCGLIENTANGFSFVEVVERKYATTMRVYNNVYAEGIQNAEVVNVAHNLFNKLTNKGGDPTKMAKAELSVLDVNDTALISGTVEFLETLELGLDSANVYTNFNDIKSALSTVVIDELNSIGALTFSVKENAVVGNTDTSGNGLGNVIVKDKGTGFPSKVEIGNGNGLTGDNFVSNGKFVVGDTCYDKSTLTVDRISKVILTCRNDHLDPNKLTWQSDYYGEISAFNGSCPSGWEEIPDVHGSLLRGSGTYKEDLQPRETLKVRDKGGESFVQLLENQMPDHHHATPKFDHICNTCHRGIEEEDCPPPWKWQWHNGEKRCIYTQGMSGARAGESKFSYDSNRVSNEVGNDRPHENRPNYVGVTYCMYSKGDGLSPNVTPVTDPENWVLCDGTLCNHEVSGWLDDEVKKYHNCDLSTTSRDYSPEEGVFYTRTSCLIDQVKIIKEREIDLSSGAIRYTGVELEDRRTIGDVSASPNINNLIFEIWKEMPPQYTEWKNVGDVYECTPESKFYDSAKNDYYMKKTCKQDQERIKSRFEKELRFGDIRPLDDKWWWGDKKVQEQTIYVDFYRKVASGGFDGVNPDDLKILEGDYGTTTVLPLTIKLSKPFEEDVLFRITTQDITTTSLLSKTQPLVYDEFGSPFISIVDNPNGGRLMFDGGFPKFYNSSHDWDDMKNFKDLPAQFKFMHNVIKWVGETHKKRGKILLYGDRSGNKTSTSYGVYSKAGSGFYYSIPKTIEVAGFNGIVKDHTDYGGVYSSKKASISLNEMNKYSAIVVMSSGGWESLDNETANNFSTYVNNGGGVYIITDHDWFQKTGNQILTKFGSEFYGVVNRNRNDPAYKLETVWNALKGSEYGEHHDLWKGLDEDDSIPAGGSEGNVKVFTPIEDFVAHTEDLLFRAGETTKTINIVINGDDIAEQDEKFKIVLTSPEDGGIVLGQSELIATIIDDDSGVKTMTLSCNGGSLVNGSCFKTMKSAQKSSAVLKESNAFQETGSLKVRHTTTGDMYLKYSFDTISGEITCNKEDIKETLVNSAKKEKSLGKLKTIISIEDLIVRKTNSWKSSKTSHEDFENGASCAGLRHGIDYNFDIKASFKEEVFDFKSGCESGQTLKDGYCLDIIEFKPIEECTGGYKLDSGYCFKI